ncbi:hypothetical protein ACIRVF_29940 [Kitasatospora sp. NPDC101157]|uniref:hypothetical protein n=1 Tax=Kitasatospora sp. NPDC101157 TaxID=3364098 RepID=UPI003803D400
MAVPRRTSSHGYISRSYPVTARAGAVGVALGAGRIGAIAGPLLGGWSSQPI